jgi:4-carboxymuconolactone decarboxylase
MDFEDRLKKGEEIQIASLGRARTNMKVWKELAPDHAEAILGWCFGTAWNQPLLDFKTREFIVMATVLGQDLREEVGKHIRGALNRGATPEEVVEVIIQCSPYVGIPKTNHALLEAKNVFDQWDERDDWKP